MQKIYLDIAAKISWGERLSRQDGLSLLACDNLTWLGHLADSARQPEDKQDVYFGVNRHISLTNICVAKCDCCIEGCDETSPEAFFLTKEKVLDIARQASRDGDLRELHIGSGLHPQWGLGYYTDILQSVKTALPDMHLKAFTTAEIHHFTQITSQPPETVLKTLQQAGLDSLLGDPADFLAGRVRESFYRNKPGPAQCLDIVRAAHRLGIPSDAAMFYGSVESPEELVDSLLAVRSLQDATSGFQTFIPVPFRYPDANPGPETSAWEDLKTVAVSRLMLDNFRFLKADLGSLSLPVGQLALAFGANDLDGTLREQKNSHAGAGSDRYLSKDALIRLIRQTGRTPVQRDSNYNVIQKY